MLKSSQKLKVPNFINKFLALYKQHDVGYCQYMMENQHNASRIAIANQI